MQASRRTAESQKAKVDGDQMSNHEDALPDDSGSQDDEPSLSIHTIEDDIENETLVASAGPGTLVGEAAMIFHDDPKRNRRTTSGRCTSDVAIAITMNRAIWDILLSEQMRKERETLANFLYTQSIPKVNRHYTYTKIITQCHIVKQATVKKNEVIIREGDCSEKVYIVREG